MPRVSLAPLCLVCLGVFLRNAQAEDRPKLEVTEEAKRIHAAGFLFDGHNDLPWAFRQIGRPSFEKVDIAKSQKQFHTDLPRLRKGGVKAVFWSVYVPASTRLRGESLQTTLEQIDFVQEMVEAYPDELRLCLTSADVEAAKRDGKIASMIGMEGGHSIENSIGVLRRLYSLGARYMTLTHSDTLDWADSATDEAKHGGLTEFGEEVVREMNRIGMLVDLSHVSDDTMRDVFRIARAPVIYSHSSARAIGDHPRNVPDDVLPLVKKNGGVIMVNFYPAFVSPEAIAVRKQRDAFKEELTQKYAESNEENRDKKIEKELAKWDLDHPTPQGSVYDVLDHIDHLIKKCGVDHVGIGSDYDGIGSVPKQLEDVSTFPLITQGLLNLGYSEKDIHKVLGDNVMRALRNAEKVAAELK